MSRNRWFLVLLLDMIWLSACSQAIIAPVLNTPIPLSDQDTRSISPTIPDPIATPTHSQPTPVPEPVQLIATVWEDLPQVPILMYHRFNPVPGAVSSNLNTSLSDFDGQLKALYEAGFSLVPLNDWLRGEIHLPEGRRPLMITFDDLFYADQISLDENGQPASYSGVGRLWQFSKDHPDFNFHVALFYNFGDKSYANNYSNGSFTIQDGWRQDRAEAIIWGIEHGAIPMNHFYEHPFLDRLKPDEIEWQLGENDAALRDALALAGQEELSANLPNILALPYLVWPVTEAGKQVLFKYTSPEGAPVTAIVEGGYASTSRLFSAPFDPSFDPWHVPRIGASWEAIDIILKFADEIPTAAHCDLGEFYGDAVTNAGQISTEILALTNQKRCPTGYYVVGQLAFHVKENEVIQLSP